MPLQQSSFLCGCLSKRARIPKPLHEEHNRNDRVVVPGCKHEPGIPHQEDPRATPIDTKVASHPSIVAISEESPLSAAFARAYLSRTDDEKIALGKTQSLRDLFAKLDSTNTKSKEQSRFRRGVEILQPTLQMLGSSMNLASPLAALDPIASNAFGIVQSVVKIAIGICGAEIEFQEHVATILRGVPVIERCDKIWDSNHSQDSSVTQVLVEIYNHLIDFYFEAMHILDSGSFFGNVQKSRFKQKLSEIAASFEVNTEKLNTLISQETYAGVKKIDDDQWNIEIRRMLDTGSQSKQIEYYNSLKQRADEACTWIISSSNFRAWLEDPNRGTPSSSSKICILFGEMGSGKSATTSFVVDFLTSHPVFSGSLNPLVCVYYCKNDNESNKARSIYRSILAQVLARMGQLRPRFLDWHEKAQLKNSLIDPTWDDNALRGFLVDVLATLPRRLYIVLDGVDECDHNSRHHILQFFRECHEYKAPVKVFLSCRYDDTLEEGLPPGRSILRMKSSTERDRIIAAFLVEIFLARQREEVRKFIVDGLAVQAEGSAIWLKIVLEHLRHPHRGEAEIRKELTDMPPPGNLSKLYAKLLETTTGKNKHYVTRVEVALEILATTGRLLTLDELAYAATLRLKGNGISDLSDLQNDVVDPTGLRELMNPFVGISGHGGDAIIRIVHQSLKDLVLRKAPADWGSDEHVTEQSKDQRQAKLHSSLLDCCIKYLLLDDIQETELFPEEKLEALERQENEQDFLGSFNVGSNDDDANESPERDISIPTQTQPQSFDPEAAGLGKFYAYAACYWTEHLKLCSPEALPDCEDVSRLARRGSLTLRNWFETYKRPNLTSAMQLNLNVEEYDELVVGVYFGSHAFLVKFLDRGFDVGNIRGASPMKALDFLMRRGDLTAVKILLQNKSLEETFRSGKTLCDIIRIWKDTAIAEAANRVRWQELWRDAVIAKGSKQAKGKKIWNEAATAEAENKANWKELLEILTRNFFSTNDATSYTWANTFLCAAARNNCVPLIEMLFERASREATMYDALLAETQVDTPYQSVGEAAFWGKAEAVRYLLTQEYVDITPHLHHRTQGDRRNVLHLAAKSKNPDIIRILAEKFPSGVEERTATNDTPLLILIFGSHTSSEAVQALVETGKADVNFSPGEGCDEIDEYYSPLRLAVRAKNVDVCRLLASYGARVDHALEVDATSGELRLKDADLLNDVDTANQILWLLVPFSQTDTFKKHFETGMQGKVR